MVERHLIQDFSQKTEINHWDHIYNQRNFLGTCYRQRINKAISWLDASNLSKNPLILDAGCGAGVLTREIAKRKYKVCGLDYSSGMIERAKNICNTMGNLDVQFFQGDIQTLPFKD
ncbi:MAG: methyltransferase domain-containing protein, partial [Desulfatiglandales bacterium]